MLAKLVESKWLYRRQRADLVNGLSIKRGHEILADGISCHAIGGRNIEAVKRAGYEPVNWFTLSKQDWSVNFYQPLQRSIAALRTAYPNHPLAQQAAAKEQAEIDLWTAHGDDYGYVFYSCQQDVINQPLAGVPSGFLACYQTLPSM